MRCADRSWCDYVVFDPRMPIKAQLFVFRVQRNEDFLTMAEDEVITFLTEVDIKVAALNQIIGE
jgi:hypothetical protein